MRCKDCGKPIEECRPNRDCICSGCAVERKARLRPSKYVLVPKNLRAKYIIDGKEG